MKTDTKDDAARSGVRTEYGGLSPMRFKITWTKRPAAGKRESLSAVNKRITAKHGEMLKRAEANCLKLTGKPRL